MRGAFIIANHSSHAARPRFRHRAESLFERRLAGTEHGELPANLFNEIEIGEMRSMPFCQASLLTTPNSSAS